MGVTSPRKHIDSDVPAPRVTTFRVDRDVLNRLDIYAVRTRRSRNSAVNDLLMVALDQEDAARFDAPERH
jgi:predicted transcriptional regulator